MNKTPNNQLGAITLIIAIIGVMAVIIAAIGVFVVYTKMNSKLSDSATYDYSKLPSTPKGQESGATDSSSNTDTQVKVNSPSDLDSVQKELDSTDLNIDSSINY